ncbi:hypothetical protein TNCV_4126261 [Trichonephila clavipes]|nr:hypothetical protein TNCV_4126261 [Trichonephila clavipes]
MWSLYEKLFILFAHVFVNDMLVLSSGSISLFHTTSPGSIPGLGKVDSSFHPFIGSINEYQACLESKILGASLQTDHLIWTFAHAPQRPMVTYTGMGTVGPGPHGPMCH